MSTEDMSPEQREEIEARNITVKARYGESWNGYADDAEKDRDALLAELTRAEKTVQTAQKLHEEMLDEVFKYIPLDVLDGFLGEQVADDTREETLIYWMRSVLQELRRQ